MRSIRSYLPDPDNRELDTIVTARVPVKMKAKILTIAKANGWTHSQVIRAAFEKFIDDEYPPKAKAS